MCLQMHVCDHVVVGLKVCSTCVVLEPLRKKCIIHGKMWVNWYIRVTSKDKGPHFQQFATP
jgi:hypothetical protein